MDLMNEGLNDYKWGIVMMPPGSRLSKVASGYYIVNNRIKLDLSLLNRLPITIPNSLVSKKLCLFILGDYTTSGSGCQVRCNKNYNVLRKWQNYLYLKRKTVI